MNAPIRILPDPAFPLGGHAIARIAELSQGTENVTLILRDRYTDRYLGSAGWQSARAEIGPLQVHSDDEGVYICLGPQIVDAMSEFLPFELTIDGATVEGTWPAEIAPAPPVPKTSGVMTRKPPHPTAPEPLLKKSEPAPGPKEPHPGSPPEEDPDQSGRSRWPLFVGLALLACIAATLAYLFLMPTDDDTAPVATVDPCSSIGLTAGGRSYAEAVQVMTACDVVDQNDAIAVLEWGEAAGSAEAALSLGQLYDPAIEDPLYEARLGIAMDPRPDLAITQYARAAELGSAPARAALATVCETLATRQDSLSQIAYQDHCQE